MCLFANDFTPEELVFNKMLILATKVQGARHGEWGGDGLWELQGAAGSSFIFLLH